MNTTLLSTGAPAVPQASGAAPRDAAFEATAAALYPAAAPKPQDRAPTAEIQALRDSEPARSFYRDDMQLGKAPRDLVVAADPGIRSDALEGQASIVASIMTDIGMSRDDVSQLASFAAQYAANKPNVAEQAAHQLAAKKELREKYGEHGYGEALDGAMRLAQRDPRLSKFLDATGLHSHPWLVLRLAELARSARNAPTLKQRA